MTAILTSHNSDDDLSQQNRVSINLCAECSYTLQVDPHLPEFSKILTHLRSGYNHLDAESSAKYDRLFQETQINLNRCQKEINRLNELSSSLAAVQGLLERNKALIISILSPIQTLPDDILGEIFKYVCFDFHVFLNDTVPNSILSQVCYRWHNLVSSMPILWSSLRFREDFHEAKGQCLMDIYLRRSIPYPLDIRLNESCLRRFDVLPMSQYLLPLLLPKQHSDRWRHVTIDTLNSSSYLLRPLIDSRTELPALKSLDLQTETNDSVLVFPVTCPNLSSLSLARRCLDLRFPRPSITRLCLERISYIHALGVISYCPNVQELVLIQQLLWPSVDDPQDQIDRQLCNATKLVLSTAFSHQKAIPSFLRRIDLPKLKSLYYSDREPHVNLDVTEDICTMLERSQCDLTSLTLGLGYVEQLSTSHLLRLFSCTPLLAELEVQEYVTAKRGTYSVLKSLVAPHSVGNPQRRNDEAIEMEMENEETANSSEESEYNLDKHDKKDTTRVPEGVCLLPNMTKLRLIIRPRNQLLLELVRSRWRPALLKAGSLPGQEDDPDENGHCVCLQSFHLQYPNSHAEHEVNQRLDLLRQSLQEFKNNGMNVEVVPVSEWSINE
ncbi:hypothetical protein C8R42DRAFT_726139 [Lentinula raphanica]|nr:hypothetical protein C8R42DRAFT_726139 [Lentinula raphanica]